MLPSAAPTPPCAATVCERVGKTLESTATLRPVSASCSAARSPAPPAPTTTASNLRTVRLNLDTLFLQARQRICTAQPPQATSARITASSSITRTAVGFA